MLKGSRPLQFLDRLPKQANSFLSLECSASPFSCCCVVLFAFSQLLMELFLCRVTLSEAAAMGLEHFKKLGHYPSSCWIWESWLYVLECQGTACAHIQRNRCHCTTGDNMDTGARKQQLLQHWFDTVPQPEPGSGLLCGIVLFGCPPSWHPATLLMKQWAQVSQFGSTKSGEEVALASVLSPGHSLRRAGGYSA